MATHSSVLAWRIPGTGEPGGLPSMGLHRVRHDWSNLAAAAAAAGLPVHHQLPEFTQTYVHRVRNAIQPLLSPSPPAFNLSQHQGLFHSVNSLHHVPKVLEFQLQHQSFQEYPGLISFRMDSFDILAFQGIFKSLFQWINSSHDLAKILELTLRQNYSKVLESKTLFGIRQGLIHI